MRMPVRLLRFLLLSERKYDLCSLKHNSWLVKMSSVIANVSHACRAAKEWKIALGDSIMLGKR